MLLLYTVDNNGDRLAVSAAVAELTERGVNDLYMSRHRGGETRLDRGYYHCEAGATATETIVLPLYRTSVAYFDTSYFCTPQGDYVMREGYLQSRCSKEL